MLPLMSLAVLCLLLVTVLPQTTAEFTDVCMNGIVDVQLEFTVRNGDGETSTEYIAAYAEHYTAPKPHVAGMLVEPVHNSLGCSETTYAAPPSDIDWIALVERGNCTFGTKAYSALYHGAKAILVYMHNEEPPNTLMHEIPGNMTAVLIDREISLRLISQLQNGSQVNVSLTDAAALHIAAEAMKQNDASNSILFIFTSVMSPVAIILNSVALLAIIYYPEKPKPYLYLIANLIITDLLVAIIGTAMILLLYPEFHSTDEYTEYSQVYRPCIGNFLDEAWDVTLLSNILTLFNLTAEHFIAFRWPLKHKIMVTKQRVTILIIISWIVSLLPMACRLVSGYLDKEVPKCYSDEGYCWRTYYWLRIHESDHESFSWQSSVLWVVLFSVVLCVMVMVYGYIIAVINRVSIRNPGFRKKRAAVITTLCLILSFVLSYIFYFVKQFMFVATKDNSVDMSVIFKDTCPACVLLLDYLCTGMIGAIMDPIIYCARMKEIKLALSKLCKLSLFKRRPSVTSHSGYIRAAQQSTTDNMCEEDL